MHLLLVGALVFSQGLRAQTTEVTYYIPDALGSPIAAMDEAGNIKWRKHYQPFGKEIEQDEASRDNRIGYTGHVHDRASGLTYMGARYYDPEIGRFLSMDPAAVNPNDPRTFNRFAYANNSPYKYHDPDGRFAFLIIPAAEYTASWAALDLGLGAAFAWGAANFTKPTLNENADDKRRTSEEEALEDIIVDITDDGRKPLSGDDGDAAIDLGEELGLDPKDHRGDKGKKQGSDENHWKGGDHIHIDKIRVRDGKTHIRADPPVEN
jgi:RHS repeat-associated protein